MCTGTSSIDCHFGGAPGNYEVTVELGGPQAGNTYVDAEAFRRMIAQTATTAGMTRRLSFVVNVRANEAEPIRPNDSPTDQHTAGTPGLDVYFRGPMPKATFICHKLATKSTMIWLAGDSTVADQQFLPFATWGQHLPQHFLPPISVANYADSGESSSSHLGRAGLWGAIKAGMKAGDWVFVQFGHNDDSAAVLRTNLGTFVRDAKAVGAFPVLVSPQSRATFSGTTLSAQHGTFPATFRQVAEENNVAFIDLTALTTTWLRMVGSTGWQPYFSNGTDRTHPNHAGADVISIIVRDAVRAGIPELAKHMR